MPRRAIEETGHVYGRLTVIARSPGNERVVASDNLRRGVTRSCGCLVLRHGHLRGHLATPEYASWEGMRSRCNNPNNDGYADYGGRGIRICARWDSFVTFLADMGPRPEGTTLDRVDNDGGYEPDNCRWATASEQNRNRRRSKPE